jgi:hypothetical protein
MTDDFSNDSKTSPIDKKVAERRQKRRKFVTGLTGTTIAGVASTQGKWVTPVVEKVMLPAHAQTTTGSTEPDIIVQLEVGGGEFNELSQTTFNDGTHSINSDPASDAGAAFDIDDMSLDFDIQVLGSNEVHQVSTDIDISYNGTGDLISNLNMGNSFFIGPSDWAGHAGDAEIDIDTPAADEDVTIVADFDVAGIGERSITLNVNIPGFVT